MPLAVVGVPLSLSAALDLESETEHDGQSPAGWWEIEL
jgi:hypothetical protein